MIINKKVKRTMMESKAQYLGSLMLIIISCLLFTMFNQLAINMREITSSFEEKYKQEDASFFTDKKLTNVEALEAKFNMSMEEIHTLDYSISQDKILRIFSQSSKVNKPAVVEGNMLREKEVLIDPAFANANKLSIGDSIKIYDQNFKISGFMALPNYIYPLKEESDILNDPKNFGVAVMMREDFDNIKKGTSFYSVRFNGDRNDLKGRVSNFLDYLKNEKIIVLKWINANENSRIIFVSAKVDSISKISTSMPVVILLLTCILTGIVMWRMIKRESTIIGSLYALGYRKKEIQKHYIVYPLSIALVGGAIGTIFGILTLRPMLDVMVEYFNMPVESVSFNIIYIIISIILPVVFLVISGYFVVNKTLKNSPVELMRGNKANSKVNFAERNLRLERFKFSTKFKIREQLRSLPRSIFLLLGVVVATMLLLLGFASKSSMDYLMKDSFEQTYKYNYHYVFNTIQRGNPEAGEAFSEGVFTTKSQSDLSFAVYGINPATQYIMLKDRTGNLLNTNAVIITRPLADKLSIKPNDSLQVINKLDSRVYIIRIDSIAETYAGSYIYMPLHKFNDMFGYPADSYMGLWSKDKLDIPQDRLFGSITVNDLKNAYGAMMQPIQAAIGTMAFLSFVIGLIVIYVVTSLIIEENRGNISLMKVLGYRKKEIYSLILNSSSFIVVIGYILGVPLLLGILDVMFKSMFNTLAIAIPVTINYSYIVIGFVIIYLTYTISKVLSRRKVNRISMSEALKSGME